MSGTDLGARPLFEPAPERPPAARPAPRPKTAPGGRAAPAGYSRCAFVAGVVPTPVGDAPRVPAELGPRDHLGALLVRLGACRNSFVVPPGLYAVGAPDQDSPVLVSANYKLSFDHLRSRLGRTDAWILVADTKGINVWCAAGKGTFSAREIARVAALSGLEKVVAHRRLILPQLAAPGVDGRLLRELSGFRAVWGPVRASDLPRFLEQGPDREMRRVDFPLAERLKVAPVEVKNSLGLGFWILLALFFLSSVGPGDYSLSRTWDAFLAGAAACALAFASGILFFPALLPWLPGRSFSVKGGAVGAACGLVAALLWAGPLGFWAGSAMVLFSTALASWLGMNFTGSTPFTSPSGVEAEMRRYMPWQIALALLAAAAWAGQAFTGGGS